MEFKWVYITNPNREEALRLAKALLKEKLIACANVYDGVTSVYEWEGEAKEDSETVLIAKTRAELFEELWNRVEKLHPYDCPCVVGLDISDANPAYLEWIRSTTKVIE